MEYYSGNKILCASSKNVPLIFTTGGRASPNSLRKSSPIYSGGIYGSRRKSMTVEEAWDKDIVDVVLNVNKGYLTIMSCGSFLFINEKNGERVRVNKHQKIQYGDTKKGGVCLAGQNSSRKSLSIYSGGIYGSRRKSMTVEEAWNKDIVGVVLNGKKRAIEP